MHPHSGARPGDALEVDRTADRLDVGPNHVHAHTAARHARDLGGRGEARLKDELQHAVGGHGLRVGGRDEPAGDRLLADLLEGDATTIVGDLDRDPPALVEGPQRQPPGAGLAPGDANVGGLDAVVDRVADEVRERVADALDQRPVEFGIGPVDHQLHLLAAGDGKVTNGAWKAAEHVLDGLEPRLDCGLLQRAGDGIDPLRAGLHGGLVTVDAPQLVAGQNELADEVEDRCQERDIDADGGLGGGGWAWTRDGRWHRRPRWRRRRRLLGSWCGGSRTSGRGCGRGQLRGSRRGFRWWIGSDDDTGRPAGGLRLSCRGLLGRRGERARKFAVVVIPFATGGLDRLQDRPHRIDHRIQRAGDAVIERGLAVPEFAEQMLPAVGERPELRKPEKAAVALDGVNRAEHARQPLRISRVGLQREQVLVELIEVFTRLDEKLRNELAVVRHPFPAVAAGRGVIDGAGRERRVIYGDFAACP